MCWPCKLMSNHVASALALLALATAPTSAQPRNEIPRTAYYAAVSEFYRGEYRDVERDFRRLTRSGVRSTQARWIDSVCYHAMLGEVLYHQGRNAEALAEFDQACLLLLTYPDFMARVKFEDPRPMGKTVRQPPWGVPTRRFVLGDYAETMQVLMGDLGGAQRAAREGGTFMQPQYWRVNVAEIVRSAAIAIRRRNEILGPLGKYDRISKELSATFARRGLVPSNHWSQAWIELLEGLSKAGVGLNGEAQAHLARALIVLGRWDHPLTGFVLVEQGRLALAAGDHRAAASLLSEASYSGFFYEDLDVVTESLRLGWTNHRASGAGGAYPPLAAAAVWAQANRLDHVATLMRLAQAENMVRQGQLPPAAAALTEAQRQIGSMRGSRADVELKYLQAMLGFAQPDTGSTRGRRGAEPAAATAGLYQALTAQSAVSLRNFQIVLASERFDSRELSPRLAVDLYGILLSDPSPSEWAQQPFDTLAVLKTPHDAAFDRWFLAALDRKNAALALEIAERAKRARFLTSLPLGGRLLSMREILEAPASQLSVAAALERQQLLASAPGYRDLSAAAVRIGAQLRDGPLVAPADGRDAGPPDAAAVDSQSLHKQFDAWRQNADAREQILLRMALSPLPSSLVFPPLRPTLELQHALAPGEALVVFHVAGGNLFGFLVSRDAQHVWQIDDARRLQRAIGDLLRSLGNFGRGRELSTDDLTNEEWRAAAAELYELIFAGSRFEWSKTKKLVIVPDDWLWYVPFEALIVPGGEELIADRVPMHYGPTASLAVGDARPFRRPRHTGILASDGLAGGDDLADGSSLSEAVVGAVPLTLPLVEPGYLMAPLLDGLVVFDDLEVDPKHPYDWSPLARGGGRRTGRSGKATESLIGWMGLPYDGPERIALAGFSTAAENGLKGVDRTVAGREMFYAVCGLMAGGGRTILISRWRTGGQVNVQMVREFVQELPHASAADAWQRSMLLARESPLDAAAEPRLKKLDAAAEPPSADHPFFWAGYQLIDTGTRPKSDDEPIEDPPAAAAAKPGQ